MDRIKSGDYKSVFLAFLVAVALLLGSAGMPAQFGMLPTLAALALPPVLGLVVAGGGFTVGGVALALCFAAGSVLDFRITALLAALSVPFALTAGFVLRKKIGFAIA